MSNKLNVVLIILDALRADHLSSYGYFRKTSPLIDKIASRGVLYENAFSAAEWSPPSHASLFTGKYPSDHGTLGRNIFLSPRNTTIAEVLKINGFNTLAVTANSLIVPTNGFGKGFEKFTDTRVKLTSPSYLKPDPRAFLHTLANGHDNYTLRTISYIEKAIKERKRKQKPFFLFTNLFNCHAPYDPPYPFKHKFCQCFSESRFFFLNLIISKLLGKTTERINISGTSIDKLNYASHDKGQFAFMAGELEISESEWAIIKSWYDGEIAYLDSRLAELVTLLEDRGLYDDTLLIITSDHGDNFGDYGLASHHFNLYDSILHVPLIFSCPSAVPKGKRIKNIVSLIDVFPTILDLLEIRDPINDIRGTSLLPFEDRPFHDFVCAECGTSVTSLGLKQVQSFRLFKDKVIDHDKGLKCLRTARFKYVLWSDQREELYDLKDDPLEKNNIASRFPKKIKELREKLGKAIDVSYFGPTKFPRKKGGNEMLDRLRALGYV